jgi:DNA-binding NarL/FixJ family response regulator
MDQLWDSTVAALARAPIEPEAWDDALAGVTALTGASVGHLVTIGGPGWLQANWLTGVPPEGPEAMLAAGVVSPEHSPRVRKALATPVMQLVTEREVLAGRERAEFPLYTTLDQLDCGFSSQLWLHKQDGLMVSLAVGSHSRHEGGRGHDHVRFTRLAELAAEAVRLQIRLERDGAALLARSLGSQAGAAFVFSADARLLQTTAEAERLLAEGDRLRLRGGRLRAGFGPDDLRLAAALSRASAGEEWTCSLLVRDPDGARPLMLDVASWGRSAHALGFGPAVLVTVRHDGAAAVRGAAAVGAAYGFTRSETLVTEALALGRSPEAVAAERGVVVSTVRTQIRSLYAKAGVTRQAELVALVLGREPAPPD